MPFMFVHPAAALPFYRCLGRYGVLSALIIGSLTPDMHYFLPFAVSRSAAHSPIGLILFCLPVGIALYFLYHLLLKHPLALLLPPTIASRISPWLKPGRLPNARWSAIAFSLLVGAATHLAWDAFTHRHGPMVVALPALRSVWFTLGNYPFAGYAVLQQVSNVLGFVLLATWSWRWLRSQSTQPITPLDHTLSPAQRRLILGVLLFASAVGATIAIRSVPIAPMDLKSLHNTFKQAVLAAMSNGALALVADSLFWKIRAKRHRVPSL